MNLLQGTVRAAVNPYNGSIREGSLEGGSHALQDLQQLQRQEAQPHAPARHTTGVDLLACLFCIAVIGFSFSTAGQCRSVRVQAGMSKLFNLRFIYVIKRP